MGVRGPENGMSAGERDASQRGDNKWAEGRGGGLVLAGILFNIRVLKLVLISASSH